MGLISRAARGAARAAKKPSVSDPVSMRMERARRLGFDTETPLYHGTGADVEEFDLSHGGKNFGGRDARLGVSLTSEPWNASDFAADTAHRGGAPNVMPLYARGRFFDVSELDLQAGAGETHSMLEEMARVAERARAEGYDGIAVHGVARGMPTVEYKVFPDAEGRMSNIRSRFAAFDPARSNSSDLLAGVTAGGVLGGGLLSAAQRRRQYA